MLNLDYQVNLVYQVTVGSMDCTHISWSNALKHMINTTRGKEKESTLSFQVVCSQTRLIFHYSNYFFGTSNDQTVFNNNQTTVIKQNSFSK